MLEATDRITLNAAELEFGDVSIGLPTGGPCSGVLSPSRTEVNAETQTATFLFTQPRSRPAAITLTLDYRGKINTQATGLFALDYQDAQGKKRALFTQFEAPDARRFFADVRRAAIPHALRPLGRRARRPDGGQQHAGGRRARPCPTAAAMVTFRTTPTMSCYLLFLAVGDFDRITTTAAGTEIGIVTRRATASRAAGRSKARRGSCPSTTTISACPIRCPSSTTSPPPASSQFFGAMENWGAILTFENFLLVDPTITSEARRQAIFEVAAHEIAHQWFGDLVTMAWWDDLWLNEGFATWMETKASAALHPDW